MRVQFLTELRVEKLAEREHWRVLEPFWAQVHLEPGDVIPARYLGARRRLEVPAGYMTDFASVPRLPLAYLLAGNTAHRSALLHDWLYSNQAGRAFADRVFLAAMAAEGVPWWRRALMYAAVRATGWRAYGKGRRA
jgi:hypothetical protein